MSPTRAAIPGCAASADFVGFYEKPPRQRGGNFIIASLIWHRASLQFDEPAAGDGKQKSGGGRRNPAVVNLTGAHERTLVG
jgi:hypothetical protein